MSSVTVTFKCDTDDENRWHDSRRRRMVQILGVRNGTLRGEQVKSDDGDPPANLAGKLYENLAKRNLYMMLRLTNKSHETERHEQAVWNRL
jgi:hypothetical protein